MNEKFDPEFENRYAIRLGVLSGIAKLTDRIGRLLSKYHDKSDFMETALQFARVCVETPPAIVKLVRQGDISQSYVLLRWYLELSHLLWYLWKKPAEYKDWLAGKQIRPKQIGAFFEQTGLPTWQATYSDWSDVLHGNQRFLENYHTIAKRTPKSIGQIVIVGNALVNVAFITQKINYFLMDILKPIAGAEELESIDKSCLEIDVVLKAMLDEQLKTEDDLMGPNTE